jgi:hypothetical protein
MSENPREAILNLATKAVTKERNNSYGPPTQDFRRAAEMLTSMGFFWCDNSDEAGGGLCHDIQPHHIAMIQVIIKLSRATWSPGHMDHWVDIAGYAACGWECVENEDITN